MTRLVRALSADLDIAITRRYLTACVFAAAIGLVVIYGRVVAYVLVGTPPEGGR
jgi:hypothetical protein